MKFNSSRYQDPPNTLRQAIRNAIIGSTFADQIALTGSKGKTFEWKEHLVDLILLNVEDFLEIKSGDELTSPLPEESRETKLERQMRG